MTLPFLASWLLCTLGATVFAAVAPRRVSAAALAFGFVAAALLTLRTVPGVAAVAGATLAMAMFVVIKPQASVLPALFAGALSGITMSLLRGQGLPLPAAVVTAASFPALSAWLSIRRPSFAPEPLREEAALLVLVLAAVVASAPTVADGWRSAVALNLLDPAGKRMAVPNWTLGIGGIALALGGLFRWWKQA